MTQVNEVAPQSRLRRIGGWFRVRWAVTLLVAVGLIAPTSWALIHNQETSPLDEWVFVDYTSKVFSQGFVRRGEVVGMFTAELMACEGVIPGGKFGTCGAGEGIYPDLPYGGQNGAADYTPAYFWATAIIGGGIHLVTGINPLTSWRMSGAFWVAAAMLMLFLLFRRWKLPDFTTVALGLIIIGAPYTMWANSFVSTDAPSLFIGVTLLYLATRIRQQSLSPWWFVLAAPIALAFKVTNMAAIGLAAMYLVGSWVVQAVRTRRGKAPLQPLTKTAGLLVPALALVASAALELGWLQILKATAVPAPPVDQGISTPLTIWEFGVQFTNFLGQTLENSPFQALKMGFIWSPLGWLSVTGVVGALFIAKRWSERAEVSTAIAIASVVMAPTLAVVFWAVNHSYFQLAPRYGSSLIPAFMLSTAFLIRNSLSRWVITIYAVALILLNIAAAIQMNHVVTH